MRIAICDDNIADRKQMERLLGRESDSRISTTGVFYIDSFGNPLSLLASAMSYDAYFFDITTTTPDIWMMVNTLRNSGVSVPIVFCSSTIDYEKCENLPTDSYFLKKPIKKADLNEMCTFLVEHTNADYRPRLTFRSEISTFGIPEEDFLYCVHKDYLTVIYKKNNTTCTAIDSIHNLWMDFVPFPSLFMPNKKTIANARYIRHIGLFSIIMNNGDKLSISPRIYSPLKKLVKEYQV
ncbi:MAG: hypothetical protein R3Y24_03505 [Eubacteriales bacterium]